MAPNLPKETTEILDFIKNSGVNIRKLAKELDIPEQRIYGWINKGAKPKWEDIQAIKKHLKLADDKANTEDWLSIVLVRRVSEILSRLNGTTSIAEEQAIFRDVKALSGDSSS